MKNDLLTYAFLRDNRTNEGFFQDFTLKTAKMKLPLHKFLFVKATAPPFQLILNYALLLLPFFFPLPPNDKPDDQKYYNDYRQPYKAADSEEGRADMAKPALYAAFSGS